MGKTAQAGLNAANEDGHILIGLADQITVDDGGIVRAFTHHTAGGEGIGLALVLGDGVVVHHGVHIAAGHQKTQTRFAQNVNGFRISPIRLGDDTHRVTGLFQHTADDGMTKRRMVHISVGDHIYKVALA